MVDGSRPWAAAREEQVGRPERGSAEWQLQVSAWIRDILSIERVQLTEHLDQPWAAIWTVDTAEGRLWFKESISCQFAECRLHEALAAIAPRYVDPPIAVDRDRCWTLMPDGGEVVETRVVEPLGVPPELLVSMVKDYARLQKLTIDERARLVDNGLSEVLPARVPSILAEFADRLVVLEADNPLRITEGQWGELQAALPAIREAAAVLAAGSVPCAFDQGDLVPTNAFLPRPGGAYRFFDLADAAWTHPFCSLVMLAKDYLRRRVDPPPAADFDLRPERIRMVLDAYLDEWDEFGSPETLHELMRAALRIGPLLRALAWDRTQSYFDLPTLRALDANSWWWLQRLTVPVTV
jgi:hypothetical protein